MNQEEFDHITMMIGMLSKDNYITRMALGDHSEGERLVYAKFETIPEDVLNDRSVEWEFPLRDGPRAIISYVKCDNLISVRCGNAEIVDLIVVGTFSDRHRDFLANNHHSDTKALIKSGLFAVKFKS